MMDKECINCGRIMEVNACNFCKDCEEKIFNPRYASFLGPKESIPCGACKKPCENTQKGCPNGEIITVSKLHDIQDKSILEYIFSESKYRPDQGWWRNHSANPKNLHVFGGDKIENPQKYIDWFLMKGWRESHKVITSAGTGNSGEWVIWKEVEVEICTPYTN